MGKRKVSFVSDYLGSLTARRVRTLGSRVGLVDLDEPMRNRRHAHI
jgi:hypothetical protein